MVLVGTMITTSTHSSLGWLFYGCVDVDVLHWIEPKLDKVLESMKVPNA